MSFLKPEAPTPPNPTDTARAATGTNVSTAIANSFLGNMNQVTPTGSVSYNPTGSYTWTDPTTNTSYTVPRFTATQTLSPTQQAIQGQNEAAQYNLAGMANAQSGRIAGLLSNGLDTNFNAQGYLAANPDVYNYAIQHGLDPTQFAKQHYAQYGIGEGRIGMASPQGGDASNIANAPSALTSFAGGGPIQSSIGNVGDITQSYGGDISAFQNQVQDALMARMNPQLQIQQQQLQQQLADQGIRYGSDAYNNAMLTYNQQANDARWGAIQQGVQAGSTMLGEMGAQAAFQNAAQQQGYEQQLGMGQFANQAQQQQYNQNAAMASFHNAGAAQQLQQQQSAFNAAQSQRNQWLQEQYAQRNQPINEITSLMSGSQVTNPTFLNTQGSQIPTTDIASLINNNFNQQMGVYQQQNQQYNSLVGGLLGLGAGAMKASDERVKENVERIGSVLSADPDDEKHMGKVFSAEELPIYRYSYKDDPVSTRHIGPMAQDVEKLDRGAVRTIGGVKHIDTRKVMGNILRAA